MHTSWSRHYNYRERKLVHLWHTSSGWYLHDWSHHFFPWPSMVPEPPTTRPLTFLKASHWLESCPVHTLGELGETRLPDTYKSHKNSHSSLRVTFSKYDLTYIHWLVCCSELSTLSNLVIFNRQCIEIKLLGILKSGLCLFFFHTTK